jgi:hypothetical protein
MELENRFNSPTRRLLWAVLAGTLLVAVAVAALIYRDASRTVASLGKRHEELLDLSLVVNQIKGLNRLETAAMRVTHVGTLAQSYQLVPNALAGDELTLYSVGDVIAGIDLSQLQPADVRRDPDGSVVIRLPAAMILVSRLDNRQTHIVSRKTGFFRRADQQLESRARQYAEVSIRQEAVRQGILSNAESNGQKRIAELARALGARSVRFEGERGKGKG